MLITKVTIKGAAQAVQMFGPAQDAVARAVTDCVSEGTIPANQAEETMTRLQRIKSMLEEARTLAAGKRRGAVRLLGSPPAIVPPTDAV